jgi:putative hydrolase of the HAD superfamily
MRPLPGGWGRSMEVDLGLSKERLQERFFTPHWDDIVRGRLEIVAALTPILMDVAPHLSVETLLQYWFERDSSLDQALLSELSNLRAKGAPLHLCTVQEHRRAQYLWETLSLKERSDAIHYSAGYGSTKPEADFFHSVCVRTGYVPDDLLLVDDAQRNVDGARAAGWHALLWNGTQPLAELLGDYDGR